MMADKYHQGVPTDRWQPYRARSPLIAAMITLATLTGATMSLTSPVTTTITTSGTFTFPALMVPGSAAMTAAGAAGSGGSTLGGTGAPGAVIGAASVGTSPGDTWTITIGQNGVGQTGGVGLHAGGPGGGGTGAHGGPGGGSTGVADGATLLAEAAGGGGNGNLANHGSFTNAGGPGGTPNGAAGAGAVPGTGTVASTGATLTADGVGGTVQPIGNEVAGSNGSSGVGGAGGHYDTSIGGPAGGGGGGGGGGRKGGGGGAGAAAAGSSPVPGGGGAGGSSYVDASLSAVIETATNSGNGFVAITYEVYLPPTAPINVFPANAGFYDSASVAVPFGGKYTGGDTLAKAALRVSQDGAAYGYWNGTNFTSTTPQWVVPTTGVGVTDGGSFTVTVPSGVLADSHNYTWSLACQGTTTAEDSAFPSDFLFTATPIPTITALAPSGTISTTTPTVSWSATFSGADVQTSYRYMIYDASATPGSPGAQYDSGIVTSAAASFSLPSTGLVNGGTYFSYLQVTQTGGASSSWFAESFTVTMDGPATPTIVATAINDPTSGMPEAQIAVMDNDNLDSYADSSFEDGTVGSYTATNATLSNEATWAADGSLSVQASSTASGAVTIVQGTTAPCTPGQIITAMATVQQPALTQTVTLSVRFLNSGGGTISTVAVASAAATSTGVVLSGQTTAAPAGTVSCVKVITYTATGATQLTRFDEMGTFLGTVTTWSLGGFVGTTTAEVQGSYDGGVTWSDLRFGGALALAGESASVDDSESPFNVPLQYRARIVAPGGLVSAWSSVATITITSTYWWMFDPLNPSGAMQLKRIPPGSSAAVPANMTASLVVDQPIRQGRFNGFGSSVAVIVQGDIWAEEFDLGLYFDNPAEFAQFNALRTSLNTLCLKSDMEGTVYYAILGATRPAAILSETGRQSSPRRGLLTHVTPVAVP